MKNRVFEDGLHVTLVAPSLAGLKSGAPAAVGQITGVVATDVGADNMAVLIRKGVFNFIVEGKDATVSAVIALGAAVYLDGAVLNIDATNGVLFGYAMAPVVSGSTTTTIPVLLK